jgi:two-component system LytT family response regulator
MTGPDGPLTVVVVDDEPLARRRLARLLKKDASIEVVAQCAGGRAAVDAIREQRPDLVFLDIQMPDLDGFGVVEAIGPARMPAVVFVTAYDEYALRAFDVHAVDYLLKPYDEERFETALARARARAEGRGEGRGGLGEEEARLRALLREMVAAAAGGAAPRPRYPDRLAVRTTESTRILQVADVDWFETYGNYVRVHVGAAKYLIRSTATRLMDELDPHRFARIHRRYLVNLDRVVEIQPWFGGDAVVVLRDGTKLRLSRFYKDAFNARMLSDRSEAAPAAAE